MKVFTVLIVVSSLVLATGCARMGKKGHVGGHHKISKVVVVPVKR